MIRRALRRLDHFFFVPWDPLPAAFFRISIGCVMLVSLISNSPHWKRNLLEFNDPLAAAPPRLWYSLLDLTRDFLPAPWFGAAAVLLAVGYIAGYRAKACAAGLLVILSGMYFRNFWISNAEDTTFRMYMFYSLFLPISDRLSVDLWWRTRQGTDTPRPAPLVWPVRMVQIHIVLIYFISTGTKWMAEPAWRQGDALYYVMINPMWSRWPWPGLFYHAWTANAATYGSLLMEGLFPFLVWLRPLRPYLVGGMLLLHFTMALTLQNISFFSLAFSSGLWLFFTDEDLRRISSAVLRFFRVPIR